MTKIDRKRHPVAYWSAFIPMNLIALPVCLVLLVLASGMGEVAAILAAFAKRWKSWR